MTSGRQRAARTARAAPVLLAACKDNPSVSTATYIIEVWKWIEYTQRRVLTETKAQKGHDGFDAACKLADRMQLSAIDWKFNRPGLPFVFRVYTVNEYLKTVVHRNKEVST